MKYLVIFMTVKFVFLGNAFAMKMQHGFILANNDSFAGHLVAKGHHSRQVNLFGRLIIDDEVEKRFYEERKSENNSSKAVYFLFQAQKLDLPSLKAGDILEGHIIESLKGDYMPNNKIVTSAKYRGC